jgi:hypothetical protein
MFTQVNGQQVMLDSHRVIENFCKSLRPELSIREQAMGIADALAKDATLTRLPERLGVQPSGFLQALIVAGYNGDRAEVWLAEIAIQPNATEFVVRTTLDLSGECSILSGETAPAAALKSGGANSKIPGSLSGRVEVVAVRTAAQSTPRCSALSRQHAEAFFRLAVTVSTDYARDFGISPNRINWPVDFTIVQPAGIEPIRRQERSATN